MRNHPPINCADTIVTRECLGGRNSVGESCEFCTKTTSVTCVRSGYIPPKACASNEKDNKPTVRVEVTTLESWRSLLGTTWVLTT